MLSVGIDLIQVSRISASIDAFGERFLARVFTPAEVAYARDRPERFAARFAAKEAAKKALELDGIAWTDIEVVKQPNGACVLQLHGAALAAARPCELALSLSHEGDFATAVVIASD
ncbi:MAG: holo-ACP synthase [Kofleriaceae bacterium]